MSDFISVKWTNSKMSRYNQSEDDSVSSGESAVHSPRRKLSRWLTCKEKGKKKVSDSGTDRNESDRHDSDYEGTGDGS